MLTRKAAVWWQAANRRMTAVGSRITREAV